MINRKLVVRIVFFTLLTNLLIACTSEVKNKITPSENHLFELPKALLATRYSSLESFKAAVDITYDSSILPTVTLKYPYRDTFITSILTEGIDQGEITEAKDGSFMEKLQVVSKSPFAVRNRLNLKNIYLLARIRDHIFGPEDVAFYNLATAAAGKIHRDTNAFQLRRDSSEKGYINTFNHVTAQALITAIYSEEIADFLADVHELHHMPELITGQFTKVQLQDTLNYPTDNYVDMVNNEVGQEIGKVLKEKYNLSNKTNWTPELLAKFLSDIQSYYGWCFNVRVKPFKKDEEVIVKFSHKIDRILKNDL